MSVSVVAIESIVVITKRTPLDELVTRFNSRAQARFYLEHAGLSFEEYEAEHETYARALDALRRVLPRGVKTQLIERSFLPAFKFSGHDLVITVGPDGLVINTAKYLDAELILALNPDPKRVDGILNPFAINEARAWIDRAMAGKVAVKRLSMAKAVLNDGQSLCAANDLFIGIRSHASARYRITFGERCENQSSSGIIVSTGAGSTGWLSSVLNMATGVIRGTRVKGMQGFNASERLAVRLPWDSDDLIYAVREPFMSKTSRMTLSFGRIPAQQFLKIESQMPENGIIFSDGIESDFVNFNSGAIATICLAERKANLVSR